MPTEGSGTTTAATENSAAPAGRRPKPAVELGHHLPAHHCSRCVALPLPGDRRLEPPTWPLASVPEALGGGLGRG
jgi:hypothetical protein